MRNHNEHTTGSWRERRGKIAAIERGKKKQQKYATKQFRQRFGIIDKQTKYWPTCWYVRFSLIITLISFVRGHTHTQGIAWKQKEKKNTKENKRDFKLVKR